MNLHYQQNGDYLIPALKNEEADVPPLGKYGMLRKDYLLMHRKPLYTALAIRGALFRHCAEVEAQARIRLEKIMASQMRSAGITETLKAGDPLRWAGLMNTVKAQAEEIVLQEIIFR